MMIAALSWVLAASVDLQQFKPGPGAGDLLAIESAQTATDREWNAIVCVFRTSTFRMRSSGRC